MPSFADKLPLPGAPTTNIFANAMAQKAKPQIDFKKYRVGLGLPSFDHIHKDNALCLFLMGGTAAHTNFVALDARSSIISGARNNIVKQAERAKCTHILWIDSDMKYPPETALRLLSHQKDVVGCVYPRRVPPYDLLGTPFSGKPEQVRSGLHRMRNLGTGMLLTKLSVFEKLKKPYFRIPFREESEAEPEGWQGGEDVDLCERLNAAGVEIWCDVDLSSKIGHIGQWVFTPGLQTTQLPTGDAPIPQHLKNMALDSTVKSSDRAEGVAAE